MLQAKDIKYAVSSQADNGNKIVDVMMNEMGYTLIKIESIKEGIVPINHTLLLAPDTASCLYSCLHSLVNNPEKYLIKKEETNA